jgi:hypothetical protein
MSSELTNLTLPAVIQEIEDVLYEYPEHPYQSAFSIPELRQKLIAHILNHVPNRLRPKEFKHPAAPDDLLLYKSGSGWRWWFGAAFCTSCAKTLTG